MALTPEAKRQIVDEWLAYRVKPPDLSGYSPELIARLAAAPAGCGGAGDGKDIGPLGFPDPPIFALTDAINELPGIVTTQSCCGHRYPAADRSGEVVSPAQLWLQASAATELTLFRAAKAWPGGWGVIGDRPLQVSFIFGRTEEPVIDVILRGLETSPEALQRSGAALLEFLRPRCSW